MASRRSVRWPWVVVFLLCIAVAGVFFARPLAFRVVTWKTMRRFPAVQWIGADSLSARLLSVSLHPPLVLDARTAEEYAVSHLPTAQRIDPYRPDLRMIATPPKDTAIIVYSSVGYRGARVADWLVGQGYTRVTNLTAGIFAWANAERPLVRSGGPTVTVHPYGGRWGLLLLARHRADMPPLPRESAAP
ncbi:MAG: rhodanese-like domain-containing protein [Gemmatimonadales bacterium]